jgi:glutamine synthetase
LPYFPIIAILTNMTPADLQSFFSQHGIRDVECLFPDVSGYPRGKLMHFAGDSDAGDHG